MNGGDQSLREQAQIPETAAECIVTKRDVGIPRFLVFIIAVLSLMLVLLHLVTGWFGSMEPFSQRLVCLGLILILGTLIRPLGRKGWHGKLNWLFIIDILCIVVVIVFACYVLFDPIGFQDRSSKATLIDLALGSLLIVVVLEVTRRYLGWVLVGLPLFLILQSIFSPYMPGIFYGPPVAWIRMVEIQAMTSFGLFGVPMGAITGYILLFFVFVAFLDVVHAGDFFLDLAKAVAGHFSGGPAKVAVVGSSLIGTLSGQAIANVAATGSITIPLMKKTGYQPHYAGAIEAVASSGGQIMPPIMGLTGFLIADFLGMSYWQLCLAAAIPAVLYYVTAFMTVHFAAQRFGLHGLPRKELPRFGDTMKKGGLFVVPVVVLIITLFQGYGLARCAIYALGALLAVSMIMKHSRLTPAGLFIGVEKAARLVILVGVACAACGLIIGAFWTSGLGARLTSYIITVSGGNVLIMLIMSAIVSIILGMAIPTPVVYITLLVTAIPALVAAGVNPIAAHLFCFYFGVVSGITPPVALAAYAAAGIAGSSMMRTGFTAMRLGIAAFIVPFVFVFSPALVLEGSAIETVRVLLTGAAGLILLSAGLEGYFLRQANIIERGLLIIGGLGLIMPVVVAEVVGVILAVLVVLSQRFTPYKEPLSKLLPFRLMKKEEDDERSR